MLYVKRCLRIALNEKFEMAIQNGEKHFPPTSQLYGYTLAQSVCGEFTKLFSTQHWKNI